MGRRHKKNHAKRQKLHQSPAKSVSGAPVRPAAATAVPENLKTTTPTPQLVLTNTKKGDTINDIDFFGFPTSVFAADLRRTGWATLVIVALLTLIMLCVRSS